MERTQCCFNMGWRVCLCFLTRGKWSSMTFWTLGVVCGAEVYQPCWHIAAGAPQKSCSEIAEPVFLILWCHHASVWEGEEIMVMVGDSRISDRHRFPDIVSSVYSEAPGQEHWLSVWPCINKLSWDTEVSFLQSVVDIENLRSETSEISPLGERELLKQ